MTAWDELSYLKTMIDSYGPSGKVLLVGSRLYNGSYDRREWYKEVIGLDMQDGPGVDVVHDLEKPYSGQFDHVDCCSVLEHVARPWLLAQNIQNVMVPGASLVVSVPFSWRVHGYPSDYWRMTTEAVALLFDKVKWDRLVYVSNNLVVERPPGYRKKNKVYVERCEVVGFGWLR